MSFKPYEQNQLQTPMQWEFMIEKEHIARVVNDVVEQMNLDKKFSTYFLLRFSKRPPDLFLRGANNLSFIMAETFNEGLLQTVAGASVYTSP